MSISMVSMQHQHQHQYRQCRVLVPYSSMVEAQQHIYTMYTTHICVMLSAAHRGLGCAHRALGCVRAARIHIYMVSGYTYMCCVLVLVLWIGPLSLLYLLMLLMMLHCPCSDVSAVIATSAVLAVHLSVAG